MRGIDKVEIENWFERVEPHWRTRLNTEMREERKVRKDVLKAQKGRTGEKRNYFQSRFVPQWNGLPAAVQQAPSLNAFKSRYDTYKSKASR